MDSVEQWHYLLVLGACLAVTLPLELSGSRVYRRPRRLARALLPAVVVFLVWDVVAIAAGVWRISDGYTLGLEVPPGLPLEEALFFLVIPLCAVLTFETVRRMRTGERR
ncbi:lycopene cyclase domain-containing protein [Prauserella muralis]|uniref:Lycopene cyclase n=1 Tax=Prauserella muralis TaxID=588067 RepID=A0A2V4AHV8_9PSEU|nr:lycopene cyclase domain-containing protein [Prauserella muralis]PXY19150.1 lycopene cyclase [Prauserella muralis]TWE29061.1 lycopene cyclase domain-containing protein [Prauserella muralis]